MHTVTNVLITVLTNVIGYITIYLLTISPTFFPTIIPSYSTRVISIIGPGWAILFTRKVIVIAITHCVTLVRNEDVYDQFAILIYHARQQPQRHVLITENSFEIIRKIV